MNIQECQETKIRFNQRLKELSGYATLEEWMAQKVPNPALKMRIAFCCLLSFLICGGGKALLRFISESLNGNEHTAQLWEVMLYAFIVCIPGFLIGMYVSFFIEPVIEDKYSSKYLVTFDIDEIQKEVIVDFLNKQTYLNSLFSTWSIYSQEEISSGKVARDAVIGTMLAGPVFGAGNIARSNSEKVWQKRHDGMVFAEIKGTKKAVFLKIEGSTIKVLIEKGITFDLFKRYECMYKMAPVMQAVLEQFIPKEFKSTEPKKEVICQYCGTSLPAESKFCNSCGAKIPYLNVEKEIKMENVSVSNSLPEYSDSEIKTDNQVLQSENVISVDTNVDRKSTIKQILIAIGSIILFIVVGYFLNQIMKEIGTALIGIVIVAAFIYSLVAGTDEMKREARKIVCEGIIGIVAIIGITFFIVERPDSVENVTNSAINFIRPGAFVRDSYLTKYNDKVTIDQAFSNFFTDGKWGAYDKEGYSYVTFKGTCLYNDKDIDVCIIFKITGEYFKVDRLDINGEKQNDLMLVALLSAVYEKCDSINEDSIKEQTIKEQVTEADNSYIDVDYDDLKDTIMMYYADYYDRGVIAAEVFCELDDCITIKLYDPDVGSTLGYYDYDKKTGIWRDAETGELVDFDVTADAYAESLNIHSSYSGKNSNVSITQSKTSTSSMKDWNYNKWKDWSRSYEGGGWMNTTVDFVLNENLTNGSCGTMTLWSSGGVAEYSLYFENGVFHALNNGDFLDKEIYIHAKWNDGYVLDFYDSNDNYEVTYYVDEQAYFMATGESYYIFSESDSKYLTYDDFLGFDAYMCRLARNEIYARHGRIFNDKELQAYFNSKSWYHGSIDASNFNEDTLNKYEKYNRDLIISFESEMGYR